MGNRLTAAGTTGDWTYNDNNELESYDDTSFQYDANGNMVEKIVGGATTKFFYNPEDRLERVEDGSGNIIATYYYDPFGRRLWKDVSGTRTHFYYSDEGLVGEYDSVGNEIKTYGWKPGSTWSTDPVFMKIGNQYYWYHNDHLGTPQVMTTGSGAVVWSAKYTSFGKAIGDRPSTVDNPLRLAGQYYDQETGLQFNYHRYYGPKLGRYLRADPIGLEGGINLYAYVQNNPVNYFDPEGLLTQSYHDSTGGGWKAPPQKYNPTHDVLRNWHHTRNKHNAKVNFNQAKRKWQQMSPGKSVYHRMGPGNENNLKFVSPDGHSEAVFHPDGSHVTDPANMATYNFGDPFNNPVGHILSDVLPYYLYGNSLDDPTNLWERIWASYDGEDPCK